MRLVAIRHLGPAVLVLTLSICLAGTAYAAGANMPWEQPLQQILDSVQGPVAKPALFPWRCHEEHPARCRLADTPAGFGPDAAAIAHVGGAITASAATVICGIGMMVFARFGKFQQAGIGLSFSLMIMLICSLTLTPALIRAAGQPG